jgi:predicted NACHT family NTPase
LRLTGEALGRFLAEDGRVLAIFDGLDEIVDPTERERITRQIAGFASDHRRARVLATSRFIGYRRKILADAGFMHVTLEDLDKAQVAAFAAGWYALVLPDRPVAARLRTERVLAAFRQSASIRQLAGNPMLLTIMAIIGRHQELPRERWKLGAMEREDEVALAQLGDQSARGQGGAVLHPDRHRRPEVLADRVAAHPQLLRHRPHALAFHQHLVTDNMDLIHPQHPFLQVA